MWLFLASEIMFFAGFIGAYVVLRTGDTTGVFLEAQHHLNRTLAAINTAVLIFSSYTMAMAVGASKRGDTAKIKLFLALTILCGFGFMFIKYIEYSAKFHQHPEDLTQAQTATLEGLSPGFAAKTAEQKREYLEKLQGSGELTEAEAKAAPGLDTSRGPKSNIFYACYFTLTGFHGLHVVAGIIALGIVFGISHKFTPEYNTPVEVTGLYWHLVDLVWIFLFPIVYLI
jgi:cytochrome c oxidase subunit 3